VIRALAGLAALAFAHYSFGAKEGVTITGSHVDPVLARFIGERTDGDGERLFNTNETKALAFVKSICGGEYKSKDLRTLKANSMATEMVNRMPIPGDEKARRKAINLVGDAVSSQLGNTRAIALSSYIDPTIFDAWRLIDE